MASCQQQQQLQIERNDMSPGEGEYERVLLVKPSIYVYKIPPLMSASRGFRAADWNLSQPDWTGRLRLISKGQSCFLRIESATSGQLYCQAPVLAYPGPQVQPVVDSRRYFVVKVVSDSGRTALIGIGFADGADSFDLSVALQDYFTTIDNESKCKEPEDRPKLDMSLKGGITVNLNINGTKQNTDSARSRPPRSEGNTSDPEKPFFLPPPPGSKRK